MSKIKYPLMEVLQDVEEIQPRMGRTENQFCDFVRLYKKKYENPPKEKFTSVLKTIKTLKKLVEDGILVKKGKRYMFNTAPKCDNNEEDEDEDIDEEEEEDDDEEEDENCDQQDDDCGGDEEDCNEDEGEDDNADDDDDDDNSSDKKDEGASPCCGNNDEDDDDDSEEDDDDDDDDNDDHNCGGNSCGDENCHGNDASAPKEPSRGKSGSEKRDSMREKRGVQCKSDEKMVLNASKEASGESNKESEARKSERKCLSSESRDDKSRDKNTAENSVIEANPDKKSRGGENIAFCVRDFIDSLYRPKSHSSLEEKLPKYDDVTQENMDADDSNEEMGKILQERKRKFPAKRCKMSGSNYRSRSPLKKVKAKAFNLKRDRSEAFRSSQYYHEPMDADMEINVEKDKDIEIEYESTCERNPLSLLPPSTSRADVERRISTYSINDQKEAGPGFPENKICNARNKQPMITAFELDNVQSSTYEIEDDETSEQKFKRKADFSDDEIINDDDKESLCSVCEKTIKNP